jgi:hypothetical protein
MAYDFTDDAVLQMVRSGHRPVELPNIVVDPAAIPIIPIPLVTVCVLDHESWPCAAVVALREYDNRVRPPVVVPPPPPPSNPRGGGR